MEDIDTIGYSRFDGVSKQQDMMDERSQLIKGLQMQQKIAEGVAEGNIRGEVAEQAATQYNSVLEEQVKLRAQVRALVCYWCSYELSARTSLHC